MGVERKGMVGDEKEDQRRGKSYRHGIEEDVSKGGGVGSGSEEGGVGEE